MTATSNNLPASLTNWYASAVSNPSATSSGGLLSATPSEANTNIPGATADNKTTLPAIQPAGVLSGTTSGNSYTPTTYTAAQLSNPTSWNITPNQTVAGQLNMDLNSNSPLMQQANNQGLITANARGLLNSSIASQAAEGAMISAATPIATADAATNANAASYNANQNNTFAADNVNAQNTAAGTNADATNVSNNANASNTQQIDVTNLNNTANMNQQQVTQVANLSQDFNNNVQAIQNNQYMDQATKDYNISQLYQSYQTQTQMLQDVGSVPNVASLLTNPAPNATEPSPNAVFGPAPAAPAPAQSNGGTVICTYYHDLGWMDSDTYASDSDYGDLIFRRDPEFMVWYWSWSFGFVETLKASPALTWVIWLPVYCWSKDMAFKMSKIKVKNYPALTIAGGSIIGRAIHGIGYATYRVMKHFKFYGIAEICKTMQRTQ